MARWVVRGVGLVLLALVVVFPALFPGSGGASTTPDGATITSYDAAFVLDRDGRLSATETLQVDLPPGKHGIFRFFDLADPVDPHVRLVPHGITVTRDGRAEEFLVQVEGRGRYRNVRIGSASTTISGLHTYVIRYTIRGAVSPRGDASQLYWNLVPGGWRMPIQRSHLTVGLPVPSGRDVPCAVGAGATDGCTVQGSGTTSLTVDTGALAPNTPVSVRVPLAMATPARPSLAWPIRLDPVLGSSVLAVGVIVLLGLAGAVLGERLAATTREPKPPFPLQYAPPDGLGPAQAAYLFTERVDRDAFVASVMQTAEKGATTLQHGDGWTIAPTGKGFADLDPVSAGAVQRLGVGAGTFHADRSVASGLALKNALEDFEQSVRSWARTSALITSAGLGSIGGIVVVLGLLATGFLVFADPAGITLLAIVPGLFVLFALEVLLPGASTKRTAAGRDLWSRIGGFRRILSTPSAQDRFDFSGRQDLYTAYVPWAVAFGVADEWAQKYRVETGQEPPAPAYLGGTGSGWSSGGAASAMADDFSSTVDSAVSAYEATQRSSSSSSGGGGGFSGGGGGGGGGGGSW